MNTFRFKTNINCTGCLSTVTPVLNEEKRIEQWDVDLQHKERILSVQTDDLTAEQIKQTVEKAGFAAEQRT